MVDLWDRSFVISIPIDREPIPLIGDPYIAI